MATAVLSPAEISSKHRIPTLDGWRGVAILLVLVDHVARNGRFQYQTWATLGPFGVDIFFVLSGYLITARLLAERDHAATVSLRAFYVRRAFRILPLVCTYLIALSVLSGLDGLRDFHASEIIGSLFFFRNYQVAGHPGGIYTAHFWSLSIEEHFYLLWPAVLLFCGNRRALWIALCGALLCCWWRIYDLAHPASLLGRFLPGSIPALRVLRTDTRFDGLLVGCALAILLTYPSVRAFIFRNFPKETPLFGALFLFFNLQRTNGYPSLITYGLVGVMLASTLVVSEGLAHQWLNSRLLVWVGTVSYSLYIWQQLFLLHPTNVFPLGRFNIFPLDLICVFVVASCCFYVIERPAIALGRRHRKTAVADQTPSTTTAT